MAPENGCLEYDRFLYFQGQTVSLRECIFLTKKQMSPTAIARCYFLQFLFSQNQQAAKQQAGSSVFPLRTPEKKGNIITYPILKARSKMFFLFPRWNMLVPWSVGLHVYTYLYMGVSKNKGTPKSSIFIGFSIINHPFWGTPIFGNTHIDTQTESPNFLVCMSLATRFTLRLQFFWAWHRLGLQKMPRVMGSLKKNESLRTQN